MVIEVPTTTPNKYLALWEKYFLPLGLPILLVLVLGPLTALLISREMWYAVVVIPLLIPVGILFLRYPFVAIILWFIIMALITARGGTSTLYWLLHRLMIPGAWAVVMLSRMFKLKQYPPLRWGLPELAMVTYLVVAALSLILTTPSMRPRLFLPLVDRTFVPFMMYFLIRSIHPDNKDLQRLIIPFMLLLCWLEYTIGILANVAPGLVPSIWAGRNFGERTTGTFSDPSSYTSVLIVMMLFLLHYGLTSTKSNFMRYFLIGTFSFGFICIFLSFNRTSWFASLLILLALLYLYPKFISAWVIVALPPIILLFSVVPVLRAQAAVGYERLTGEQGQSSAEARIVLGDAGMQMFYAKPIFGWGYTKYDEHDWKFMRRVGNVAPTGYTIERGTSHNSYITMLAETGLMGTLTYFLPFIWWLFYSIKAYPKLPKEGFRSRNLLILIWLMIAFRLIMSQTSDVRFALYSLTMLWFLLGIVADMTTQALQKPEKLLR